MYDTSSHHAKLSLNYLSLGLFPDKAVLSIPSVSFNITDCPLHHCSRQCIVTLQMGVGHAMLWRDRR